MYSVQWDQAAAEEKFTEMKQKTDMGLPKIIYIYSILFYLIYINAIEIGTHHIHLYYLLQLFYK